MKISDCQGPS